MMNFLKDRDTNAQSACGTKTSSQPDWLSTMTTSAVKFVVYYVAIVITVWLVVTGTLLSLDAWLTTLK
jgi:hypothetical protein